LEKQYVLTSFGGQHAGAEVSKTAKSTGEDEVRIEQLVFMVSVLRDKLGNRATSGDWGKYMEEFGGKGWSERSFKRRLEALKARRWVAIVGDPQAIPSGRKILQGELYEATELAPIVGGDASAASGTNTTWQEKSGEESADKSGASQSGATVSPLRGTDTAGTAFEAPKGVPSSANQCHGTAGTGSRKNGNGAGSVVQNLTGEALLEAARRQLGLPPKG
jgi:hypothetical protein